MARPSQSEFTCWICNKPVDLKTSKVDDKGQAVHAECYVMSVAKAPAQPAPGQQHAS
jgi:hypothetical protein